MARFDFYEQIAEFERQNKHLGAQFVRVPENSWNSRVAVVCDRLDDFVTPNGVKIEEQNGRFWLRSDATKEFLEIINRENESEFFKKQ